MNTIPVVELKTMRESIPNMVSNIHEYQRMMSIAQKIHFWVEIKFEIELKKN